MMRYIRLTRNVSNWWVHFFVKFGLLRKDPLLFELPNHIVLEVPMQLLHEFKEIYMEECYTAGLGFRAEADSNIVDIGANGGFFSLFAASKFRNARIFSSEPVRMECVQMAVCARSGTVLLRVNPGDKHPTDGRICPDEVGGYDTIWVPAITLPQILDDQELERCHLLKMDCEGSEYEILYSCAPHYLKRIDHMAIEVHVSAEVDHNIVALAAYLEDKGFKTRRRRKAKGMLYAWQA